MRFGPLEDPLFGMFLWEYAVSKVKVFCGAMLQKFTDSYEYYRGLNCLYEAFQLLTISLL